MKRRGNGDVVAEDHPTRKYRRAKLDSSGSKRPNLGLSYGRENACLEGLEPTTF